MAARRTARGGCRGAGGGGSTGVGAGVKASNTGSAGGFPTMGNPPSSRFGNCGCFHGDSGDETFGGVVDFLALCPKLRLL